MTRQEASNQQEASGTLVPRPLDDGKFSSTNFHQHTWRRCKQKVGYLTPFAQTLRVYLFYAIPLQENNVQGLDIKENLT